MEIEYEDLILKLKQPFQSNKGTFTSAHQIIVRLKWKEWRGYGTAVFAKEYGMTAETVVNAFNLCSDIVKEHTPFEIEKLLNDLEALIPNQPTVIAAIDMALHDMLGQMTNLPIHRLWGLEGLFIPPTSISLGVMDQNDLLKQAKMLSQWPILKLKMTLTSEVELIGRLREIYQGRIWIDGNGTWNCEDAIVAANKLHQYGVELLEQPIPAGSHEQLKWVQDHSPIPIVADEDFHCIQDLLSLSGSVGVVNIKLLKCGGLRRAKEIIQLARNVGMKVMLGCKTESSLGITAIAHLAGLADYIDLDGHLNLQSDPFTGIRVNNGLITLPNRFGIGIIDRRGS
ncbi:L-alanine-DL-glutamate epimerase [Thermoactinomyces sp. DSM 45891]|uniref:dipeptide epimerase n=1 Tax=Thermoactinomyces sp. DSM 45891 TaxID=1761907 RepID=UPI000917E55E|nr:dipeptide epimerase [Thermoactinomyces sp. DSM 45891]SFX57158.1 L-alanine-DL-glutamate epimerase [Thermoactinomyces sp. DSM 45891]